MSNLCTRNCKNDYACPFMCIIGIYKGDSVSFNVGGVVSHEDISDISAASDEAKSLYELDSHSLLDAGILMSILMYCVCKLNRFNYECY